jgi:hypothetical protein
MLGCYKEGTEFSSVWESVKMGPECVRLKKSPQLEAIARERLVKALRLEKA